MSIKFNVTFKLFKFPYFKHFTDFKHEILFGFGYYCVGLCQWRRSCQDTHRQMLQHHQRV